MNTLTWRRPASLPSITQNEVHIWRVHLPLAPARYADLWQVLNEEERERARRFHFERDRQCSVTARGILRLLLAWYGVGEDGAELKPASLNFRYNAYGKPEVSGARLAFNVTHSGAMILLAFSPLQPLGVDVEYMRAQSDLESLARHFFAPEECATLLALPAEQRVQAFYNCWTRKEAYIKARGLGLSLPLDSFTVSLKPGEPAALLACTDDKRTPADWSLFALDPGQEYAGALAVCPGSSPCVVRCWDWHDALFTGL